MEVEYIKGLGCPVNINWGKEITAITIKDAKQLQAKLAQVIEQAEKEPEFSEFELKVREILYSDKPEYSASDPESWKRVSSELLELASKEALKDLPRWKKAKEYIKLGPDDFCFTLDNNGKTSPYFDTEIEKGQYYITESDIENLPKED